MSILRDAVTSRKLEADLADAGIDLVDYYRKKMSKRKLFVLAWELPLSSRLKRELGRREIGDQIEWDHSDYLMAATANFAAQNAYLTACIVWQNGGGKGEQPKEPEMIEPPGYQPPEPEFATTEDIMCFLGSLGS